MRLICPNCDAQYEVDPAVIPASGRDVQCSDCGHVWFQLPAGQMMADDEPAPGPQRAPPPADMSPPVADVAAAGQGIPADVAWPDAGAAPPETGSDASAATAADAGTAPAAGPAGAGDAPAARDIVAAVAQTMAAAAAQSGAQSGGAAAAPTTYDDDADPDDPPIAPASLRVPRPAIDDSLRALLREEADREAAVRAAEAARAGNRGLEVQTDLGLDGGPEPPRKPVPQPAAPEPEDLSAPEEAVAEAGARASRRDLLPDIEQINSTLRASTERRRPGGTEIRLPEPPEAGRRGFRTGFMSVIALAALLLLLYIFAGRLSAAVPALAPMIEAYVALVNAARVGLDALLTRALVALQRA